MTSQNILQRTRFCIGVLLMLSLCTAIFAQNNTSLQLKIQSSKKGAFVYETIPVLVTLENSSDREITTFNRLKDVGQSKDPAIFISFRDQEFIRWRPRLRIEHIPSSEYKLSPGEKITRPIYLFGYKNNRDSLFVKPGRYRIKAVIWQNEEKVESNIIEVNLQEGNKEDTSFLKELKEKEIVSLLSGISSNQRSFFDVSTYIKKRIEREKSTKKEVWDHLLGLVSKYKNSNYVDDVMSTFFMIWFCEEFTSHLKAEGNRVSFKDFEPTSRIKQCIKVRREFRDGLPDIVKQKLESFARETDNARILYLYAKVVAFQERKQAIDLLQRAKQSNPGVVMQKQIDALSEFLQ